MDAVIDINLSDVAEPLGLHVDQVSRTLALLDEGNTVPFISRYRKDQTGGLDEERIRAIHARAEQLRALAERKQWIRRTIDSQGLLTAELASQIEAAQSLRQLEDLYLPYKPKKQTRATLARERGLGPLADDVLHGRLGPDELSQRATELISPERELASVQDVLAGVRHILAEAFSERADLRERLRRLIRQQGYLVSNRAESPPEVRGRRQQHEAHFRDYFDYREPLDRVPPHRLLAINRGEKAKILRARIDVDSAVLSREASAVVLEENHPLSDLLREVLDDALARLVVPSLEREIRRELTERAEARAVEVFARNLRQVLLQPPLRGQRVLAIDPGLRSGAKLAVLDEFGSLLEHGVIYLVGAAERRAGGRRLLAEMARRHDVHVIAVGNGTGCRPAEELVGELIAGELSDQLIRYVVVNEAGASVYSASRLGREEFPDLDATIRGTVSIGRRLQDPLSELVKIDPANIGVGQYQHDIKDRHLRDSLNAVVESCVNYVGVDVNSASPALLRYVSGLNQLTARRLFDHRREHGPFVSRRQLLDVPGFGEAAFVQSAGFLKITGGDNPLDATWIHPESYSVAQRLLEVLGAQVEDVGDRQAAQALADRAAELDSAKLARELDCGELALRDIIADLVRPGRDPREDLPPPRFKQGVLKLEDLAVDMELDGTVLNVVDFGAFIDIGLHDSGLVHISQMSTGYVNSPHEVVAVGDAVKVWVLAIDKERRRVSLSMISPAERAARSSQSPASAVQNRRPRRDQRKRRDGRPRDEAATAAQAKKPNRKPRGQRRDVAVPVVLTPGMKEGKEPVRSFAALKKLLEQPPPAEPNQTDEA